MNILLLGFGNQGKKRYNILKKHCNPKIFDPKYKKFSNKSVLKNKYDYIFICCVDQFKDYFLKKYSKIWEGRILIEKPFFINKNNKKVVINLINKKRLYVAYNHRFDLGVLNFLKQKKLLSNIYYANFKYLNGGAINVKKEKWRDRGSGVIYDLMPHLIDLSSAIFRKIDLNYLKKPNQISFENRSPDYASITFNDSKKIINYEVSYVSWKNHFSIDLYSKKFSIHLNGLNKWGKSIIEIRKRTFPSGKPKIKTYKYDVKDISFFSETNDFIKNKLHSKLKQILFYSKFIDKIS
jgi:scyllo-inositol 2-dehydrogenase (NADP+)